MFEAGVRDVRNQGVLMHGVNTDPHELLDLCFRLLDGAGVMPYYFYMCDMIPNAEHWRVSVARAQELQHAIMGYLPGFATPRIVCDVPFVGKRWVHQVAEYDRERGISYWTKNYRTSIESSDPQALNRRYEYYDPIHTLPESGRRWWAEHSGARPHVNRGYGRFTLVMTPQKRPQSPWSRRRWRRLSRLPRVSTQPSVSIAEQKPSPWIGYGLEWYGEFSR